MRDYDFANALGMNETDPELMDAAAAKIRANLDQALN